MPNLAGPSPKTQEPSRAPHLQQDVKGQSVQDATLATSPPGGDTFGVPVVSPVAPPFTSPITTKTSGGATSSGFNKKLIIIPLVILLAAAASFGGYYYYTNIYSKSKGEEATLESELDEERNFASISATPSPNPSPESNIHVNSSLGFSFEAPQGWEKIDVAPDNISYKNSELEFNTSNIQYQANLNMVTQELEPETTLEAFGQSNKNERLAKFQDYQLLGSANDTLGSKPALIDDYLVFIDTLAIRQRQVYTIHNNRGYIFTFATLPELWEKHLQTFDDVRSSFTFSGAVSGARIGI